MHLGDLAPPLDHTAEAVADEAPMMIPEEDGKRKQQARSISPEAGVFGLEGEKWRMRKCDEYELMADPP